ncbi:MAG: hypothetical protein V4757_07330 [Pseudomonadota bacterium]
MSSELLVFQSSTLLELGMDFRDNWLHVLKQIVKKEADDVNGSEKDGIAAVARNIELGYDIVYQTIHKKSGKEYPSVKMMVAVEKKYGDGRPAGWSAQTEAQPQPVAPWPFELVDPEKYKRLSAAAQGAAQIRMRDEMERLLGEDPSTDQEDPRQASR